MFAFEWITNPYRKVQLYKKNKTSNAFPATVFSLKWSPLNETCHRGHFEHTPNLVIKVHKKKEKKFKLNLGVSRSRASRWVLFVYLFVCFCDLSLASYFLFCIFEFYIFYCFFLTDFCMENVAESRKNLIALVWYC